MIVTTAVMLDLDPADAARLPIRPVQLSRLDSNVVLALLQVAALRDDPSSGPLESSS